MCFDHRVETATEYNYEIEYDELTERCNGIILLYDYYSSSLPLW